MTRNTGSRLPVFISIGAQKCATTWLYRCLEQHPEVFLGPKNRIRFFEQPTHGRRNRDWYASFFQAAKDDQVIGEFCTEYSYNPESPRLIRETIPDCKLLINLRDPVARAVSAYRWHVRRGLLPNLSLNDGMRIVLSGEYRAFAANQREALSRIIPMGFYDEHLERYLDHFEIDRLFILLTSGIRRDPRRSIQAAFEFVDVDTAFVPDGLESTPLKSAGIPLLTWLERSSSGVYGTFKLWEIANRCAVRLGFERPVEALSAAHREALEELYAPHNERLRTILDRYCDHPGTISDHITANRTGWVAFPPGSAGVDGR